MRKLLLYLFFLLPVVGFSQAGEFAGTVVVLSSSGTDPNFTVATSFNSTLGFTASQAIVGDIVIARYVSGVNNYRNLYEVTSVSASGSNLTLGLTRLTGTSTSFFPSGTHAIVRKTDAGLLYDAPNVSQEIESYTTNYNLGLIDGFKVDTLTVSSDTITLSLEDGTEFVAVIPGGAGANLTSTPSTTTVTIASDSGTDAVIHAATASQAGVLTAAGYSLLQSTITSFSGDVSGVISLQNAALDINADVITTTELADNAVATANIQSNAVTLTKIVDAPANTILGNNTGSSADPLYMTAAQAQALLSVDDLITLSGVSEGAQNNGTFTGSTIADNQTTKAALQSLETAVEGKLSTTLNSAQVFVGNGSNVATARTLSGDGTLSNTGVLTVAKQNRLQFVDESSALGATGTVDTLKFTGAGVAATRSSNTVTVDISGGGGGGGIDTLTSTNGTMEITETTSTQYDIDVDIAAVRPLLDTCYSVSISGGNSGSVLWICANGGGVTASFSSGELTVVSTATSRVKSAYWKLVAADVQSGPDAGGVADYVRVKFTGTRGNTGLTDIRVPTIGKTALPSGALALNNAASYDLDNNPSTSIVECVSNSITIRVGGVSATNGYQLSFTGVH